MHRKSLLAAVVVLASLSAAAGNLTLGNTNAQGNDLRIPVVLEGDVGAGVAAMDFTLTYDPAVLEPLGVTAGPAASAADKGVQFNLLGPGRCKVVMMGLNQTVVPGGEVAVLNLRRVSSATGSTELTIERPTLSDLNATAIPSRGTTETIDLNPASDNTETPGNEKPSNGNEGENNTENPANPDPAQPGTTPAVPGADPTNPAATPPLLPGQEGVVAGLAAGSKLGAGIDPTDPKNAKRFQSMARLGGATELPRGIQPGALGTQPVTPSASGTDNASSGTSGEATAAGNVPVEGVNVPAATGVGDLAMITPGVPSQTPATTSAATPPAPEAPPTGAIGMDYTKWIGVGAIVLVLAGLFLLRRKVFS